MSCEQFSALLDAMERRAVTAEQRAAMDEHALDCPECALLLALRTLDEDVAVPDSCRHGWRNAVRSASVKGKRSPRKAFKALCAAAAVVVFLCGGTLLTRGMGWNRQNESITMDNSAPYLSSRISDSAPESSDSSEAITEDMPDADQEFEQYADRMSGASNAYSDNAGSHAQAQAPAITTFLRDMGVFLTLSAPYLALLAALTAAAILLHHRKTRHTAQHKEENP